MSSPTPALADLIPADLLPHEPPMILLDEVRSWSERGATCALTVREDNLFVRSGALRSVVALELMAQTVGVWAALDARSRDEPPGSGYLVGIRSLELRRRTVAVGEELRVDVALDHAGVELLTFDCVVVSGDDPVAVGSIGVYRHPVPST